MNLTNLTYEQRYQWQSFVVDSRERVCYIGKGATRQERHQDALDEAAAYPKGMAVKVVNILPLTGERG